MSVNMKDPGMDLAQKTVCIKLQIQALGNTRKVASGDFSVDADKDMVRMSKRLLESQELITIRRFDNEVRRYIYNTCLPFEIGIQLLPIALIQQVEDQLKAFSTQREELVEKFIKAYPERVKAAAPRLRGIYSAQDYLPVKEVHKEFRLHWQYVSFGVPDKLKGISAAMWEQEREKAAKRMQEAGAQIQLVLREAMLNLVKHMNERLKPGEDGKPKIFRDTMVTSLTEFLGNFDFRNVTDDKELQEIVVKAKKLLKGVDGDAIRNTDTLRDTLMKATEDMTKKLDKMVGKAGRAFRFDEAA